MRKSWLAGWIVASGFLVFSACASRTPQQLRIAVAEAEGDQVRACACAEACEQRHAAGTGALFQCVRACPGVNVDENEACTGGDLGYSICFANDESGALGPRDRDHAALLAIGVLRGLTAGAVPGSLVQR